MLQRDGRIERADLHDWSATPKCGTGRHSSQPSVMIDGVVVVAGSTRTDPRWRASCRRRCRARRGARGPAARHRHRRRSAACRGRHPETSRGHPNRTRRRSRLASTSACASGANRTMSIASATVISFQYASQLPGTSDSGRSLQRRSEAQRDARFGCADGDLLLDHGLSSCAQRMPDLHGVDCPAARRTPSTRRRYRCDRSTARRRRTHRRACCRGCCSRQRTTPLAPSNTSGSGVAAIQRQPEALRQARRNTPGAAR